MPTFFNCHVHLFTAKAVPPAAMVWPLVPLSRNRVTGRVISGVVRRFGREGGERLAAFSSIGRKGGSREVFEVLRRFYTPEFRFVVLSLDMDFMGAGRPPQPYLEQLEELRELKEDEELGPLLRPFVSVDPRREGVLDLVRRYVEDHDFAGIKLYPPIGYWPFDEKLDPVYEYAEAHRIPIITHCSRGGVHLRAGEFPKELRVHPLTGERLRGWTGARLTEALSDPDNYRPVLERFPRLKLCLAHYGGGEEWRRYLVRSMPVEDDESWVTKVTRLLKDERYDVYADISHLADEPEFLPLIHVFVQREDVGPKILFGSDFYMVQRKASERQFSLRLRSRLGEDGWERIASENPRRFLATDPEEAVSRIASPALSRSES